MLTPVQLCERIEEIAPGVYSQADLRRRTPRQLKMLLREIEAGLLGVRQSFGPTTRLLSMPFEAGGIPREPQGTVNYGKVGRGDEHFGVLRSDFATDRQYQEFLQSCRCSRCAGQ